MAGRLNPHVELLRAQCETLREAARVIHGERARGHVAKAAQATIAALEPLAADLVDEEFSAIPRVAEIIVSSCSVRVIDKLRQVEKGPLRVSGPQWCILLTSLDPTTIRTLLDGRLAPGGLSAPLLDRLSVDDRHIPLIPVAAEADNFFDMQTDPAPLLFDVRRPDDIAGFLRTQVSRFEDGYLISATRAAQGGDLAWLTLLFLAGVDLRRIEGRTDPDCAKIIAKVSSNHGAMELRKLTGSLEEALYKGQESLLWALGPITLAAA